MIMVTYLYYWIDWFSLKSSVITGFLILYRHFTQKKVNRNEEKAWSKQRCLEKTERRSPKNICNRLVVSDYVEPK